MNIIEEIAKKYEGNYTEESIRGSNYPSGKYTFHPQEGVIIIGDSKIILNIKAVGGAARTAEPYRIVLFLDKDYQKKLEIFPKTSFQKFIALFNSNHSTGIRESIQKQFRISGDNLLIEQLLNDHAFCQNILGEKIFILIGKKYPKRIVLSPSYGIDNLDQFEKYLAILQQIEMKVKCNST